MKRYSIGLILCISVVILSFTLPPQLMKWGDAKTVDRGYVRKTEEIALVPQVSLSLIEKIELFQRETANTLWVSKGKNYDQESIRPKVLEELQKLCDLGILEIDVSEIDFYAIEGGFVVDTEDSTQTMNIWTIYACQKEKLYELLFVLDDETGKIINIQQSYELVEYNKNSDSKKIEVVTNEAVVSESTSTEMERIAKVWAEYLGLSMVETYQTPTGTMDADREIQKDLQALIDQGIDDIEGYFKVSETWEYKEYIKNHLLCVVEDEEGMAAYFIRKNVGNVIVSIDVSM